MMSALDQINMQRLALYIKRVMGYVIPLENDDSSRKCVEEFATAYMNTLVNRKVVHDYVVVCEQANNSSLTIAKKEMHVDIAIKLSEPDEFVYLPVIIKI